MTLFADLRHVIYALSDALDLVGVDDVAHGKRVGIMAAECGRVAGMPETETAFLLDLGMLHDIGVSSTRAHCHLVEKFDWDGSQVHCEVGHALLKGFGPLEAMAEPVRYHHTRWDALPTGDVDPDTLRAANLIYLVDRVDALAASHYADNSLLLFTDDIRARIAEHAGTFFSPELVELFLDASHTEAFWLDLEPRSIQARMVESLATARDYPANTDELKHLAGIFARIVDAKSPFTAEHSLGVARLARHLAERLGVSPDNCDKLEIAGMLHDLGKLRVPDEILDKPGRLDAAEMPFEAAILRVADIFQAMVQERPYRQGLGDTEVSNFIRRMADDGRIDSRVAEVLLEDVPAARLAACPALEELPEVRVG